MPPSELVKKKRSSGVASLRIPHKIRIGITGSPGTGKKTLGKLLSQALDEELVLINDIAIKGGFGKRAGKVYNVEVNKLRGKIVTKNRIIAGHLLPYVIPDKDLDLVIVLRCSPTILRRRYELRRYRKAKIRENLEAELIGLVASKCQQEYQSKKIAEFDTSRTTPESISQRVLDIIIGRSKPSFGNIDWLSNLTAASLARQLDGKYHTFNIP